MGHEPEDILWVLSHMRSGSTVFHHILISHPEILGRGERNAHYASELDLDWLVLDTRLYQRELFGGGRYVADQINHDRFLPREQLLTHPRVRPIFLIRKPEPALASMVAVLGQHYGLTLQQALAYYEDRLSGLARYARVLGADKPALVLTYEELVQDTAASLARARRFLDLQSPLSDSYVQQRFTGSAGDPSVFIRSGRVQEARGSHDIVIPAPVRARAQEAYDACRDAFGVLRVGV
jgi:hypothetical protein